MRKIGCCTACKIKKKSYKKRGRGRVYLPPLKGAGRKHSKRHLKRRMRGKFLPLLAAVLAPSLISAILPR